MSCARLRPRKPKASSGSASLRKAGARSAGIITQFETVMNDATRMNSLPSVEEGSALAVAARGLVKCFGDVRAVDGIDLDVPRGMIFAILGPNGAGKTTLMRMLATLAAPDRG